MTCTQASDCPARDDETGNRYVSQAAQKPVARSWSAANRATTTMMDQGVASASNFIVGIVVARISGPTGLGAYALAFTVWVLLTMQYRAMITDRW